MRKGLSLVKTTDEDITKHLDRHDIDTEVLRAALKSHLDYIHRYSIDCAMLEAASLTDKHLLEEFHDKLTSAKTTYQGAITGALKETYDDIKETTSLLETPGLVLEIFEHSANAIIAAFHAFDDFSDFLEDNEERVRHAKLKRLNEKRAELIEKGQSLNAHYQTTHKLVSDLYASQQISRDEALDATALLSQTIIEAQKVADSCIDKVSENIRLINQFMDLKGLQIQEKLSKRMMSAFLLNSEESASVHQWKSPIKKLRLTLFHRLRKRKLGLLASIESLITHGFETTQNLSSFHIKCLSALLKRFPTDDYHPSQIDYYRLIKQMVNMIELIKEPAPSFEQKVEMISPLIMCEVDKKAFQSQLFSELRLGHGWFNASPNGHQKHLDVKDTLLSLFKRYQQATWDAKKSYKEQLELKISRIIKYYQFHLFEHFRLADSLKSDIRINSEHYLAELRNTVGTLINKELSDESPSPYYCAPLCGLSLFLNETQGLFDVQFDIHESPAAAIRYIYEKDIITPSLISEQTLSQPG